MKIFVALLSEAMMPTKLKLGTHVDNGWMYPVYQNQAAAAYSSLYCLSSTLLNIFSSDTTGPIEAKFHMEPQWDEGTKVYSNGPSHMTKMATMPIYGKNLKKSSSWEPNGQWPWNLVCCIKRSSTTKFIQMMTLDGPWPILRQGQLWSLMLLYGEKGKTIFQKLFSYMIWN